MSKTVSGSKYGRDPMLRQTLIAAALAFAVAIAPSGFAPADASTHHGVSLGQHDTRAPAHEASFHETGEIPWFAIG